MATNCIFTSDTCTVYTNTAPPKQPHSTRFVFAGAVGGQTVIPVPSGDVFVYLGDRHRSSALSCITLNENMRMMPHKYKLCVAGSNDMIGFAHFLHTHSDVSGFIVLDGNYTSLAGKKIYGASKSQDVGGFAGKIVVPDQEIPPNHIDIILSHLPPHEILDMNNAGRHTGDTTLAKIVQRARPSLCVFAGPAESAGMIVQNGTIFINASIVSETTEYTYGTPFIVDFCAV